MPLRTKVFPVDERHPDPAALVEAAAVIRAGGLVAFATETVYGLGADATNPEAVARIFAAKGRPSTNPLIVHADGEALARRCVLDWPDDAATLADRFWPGPLTLVLPRSEIIPDLVSAGQETVGVRVPRHEVARALIRLADRPIAAPSANRSTGISPTTAGHVLKDLEGKVDVVLDSGPTAVGIESTVLDLSGPAPTLLRPGWITVEQLSEALGRSVEWRPRGVESPRSPGQMAIHYAPKKPTYRLDPDRPDAPLPPGRYALVIVGEHPDLGSSEAVNLVRLPSPARAAWELYLVLHRLEDRDDVNFIAIIPPPDAPDWLAIRDRLWRASRSPRQD